MSIAQTNPLPITVKAARKILGKQARELTDNQIEGLIINLSSIAEAFIKSIPKY